MKVLITGGAGFIGSEIAVRLADNGHHVTSFDNLIRNGVEHNLPRLREHHVNIVRGDVRLPSDIKNVGSRFDCIIHTAANPGIPISLRNPRFDFESNAMGTFNMLEHARINNIPLIYCSTNKVYGEDINNIPLKKLKTRYEYSGKLYKKGVPVSFNVGGDDHSPYGCSKLTGDLYCREYMTNLNTPVVVNRMSTIYGTHQYGTTDQGWVAYFILSAMLGRGLTIYGDGLQVRDCLYGEDLAELYELEMLHIDKMKGAYNVGGGWDRTISVIEMIHLLEERLNITIPLKYRDWRPADHKVYYSDIRPLSKWWKPKTSVKDGVERIIQWTTKNIGILENI